jgi:hypothetical protein
VADGDAATSSQAATAAAKRRSLADYCAAWVFFLIVLVGAVLVAGVIGKPAHHDHVTTRHTVTIKPDPAKPSATVKESATSVTKEQTASSTSAVGRLLDIRGSEVFLELAFVVLAAFLCALAIQRVILGRYELKVGPIEVGSVDGVAPPSDSVKLASSQVTTITKDNLVAAAQKAAGELALRGMLGSPTGVLAGVQFRVYTYDADTDRLLPIYGTDSTETPESWQPGHGVTGQAYLSGGYVTAVGDATHDDTFQLTDAQKARYAAITQAAAVPVFNASRRVIAVLTAWTEEPDSQLISTQGETAVVALAQLVARVLVDLLGWSTDD